MLEQAYRRGWTSLQTTHRRWRFLKNKCQVCEVWKGATRVIVSAYTARITSLNHIDVFPTQASSQRLLVFRLSPSLSKLALDDKTKSGSRQPIE